MRYFVYVIKSDLDGRLYKGMSESPEARVRLHNLGKIRSTKGYRPWKLVYQEEHETLEAALAREKYFKTGDGRDFLKSLGL